MVYRVPETLDEAFSYLESSADARIIAGGTDLAVLFSEGVPVPETLVDISRIGEISEIEVRNGGVLIGAAVTIASLATSREIPVALKQGAAAIGSPQIRNIATIGGNICNASPCGDTLSPLVALNAVFTLQRTKGKREVRAEDFFKGPKTTVLGKKEILTSILIPEDALKGKSAFRMIGKRNGQVISQINGAVWMVRDGRKIKDIRISFGSVAPVPLRCKGAEELLRGRVPEDETVLDAAGRLIEEIAPIDDVRATREYRLMVAGGIFRDIVSDVLAEGRGGA